MIKMNPKQAEAVPFVRGEIAKGGEMFYSAPAGVGKMLVLAEAVRGIPRVAFVSRHMELVAQFKAQCDAFAEPITNIDFVHARTGLIGHYEVVIACESMKEVKINHPIVIRCE